MHNNVIDRLTNREQATYTRSKDLIQFHRVHADCKECLLGDEHGIFSYCEKSEMFNFSINLRTLAPQAYLFSFRGFISFNMKGDIPKRVSVKVLFSCISKKGNLFIYTHYLS
jgi:hypothetical protein